MKQVELEVSGAHRNLDGKIPITLGTVPLANVQLPNTAPYTDVPTQAPPSLDPSQAPTQPVSPASDEANGGNSLGWNLYPSLRKLK